MKQKFEKLWEAQEYDYPVHGAFAPTIMAYLHEDEEVRPAVVIVPGGGYCMVCSPEGEIVAKRFYEMGYQTFVVTYTTNLLMDHPLHTQPLRDLSRAVVLVRRHAKEFCVNPRQVAVCGFSAGGHLCGSLLVHYNAKELRENGSYAGISNRPDAGILCYPVITSGEYAHKDSFRALLGEDAPKEAYEYVSLEKQVTPDTPPVFLWHTMTDDLVPVENSLLFAQSCRIHKVPVELHLFGNGGHGMSLANQEWISHSTDGSYCMEQYFENLEYLLRQGRPLPEPFDQTKQFLPDTDIRSLYLKEEAERRLQCQADEGIAKWPEMAYCWMKKIY